jgi:putative SOS response-associated peptidase YedK
MCGRYTLRTPADALVEVFALQQAFDFTLRYNIAPTQDVPVILQEREGHARELVAMHWGLIPFWAKDPKMGGRMINARAESLADKSAFRRAFQKRRCLVPADGYFEWQRVGKQKQPYFIHRNDDRPFAFAGLWEVWHGTQPALRSYTIVTTDSNELTHHLHERMPVILHAEDYDRWLDPQNQDIESLQQLLVPWHEPDLRVDAVGTHVNHVKNDDPGCIAIQRELFS